MRRDELLRLDGVATRSLAELSATEPDLAESLRAVAADGIDCAKATTSAPLDPAPPGGVSIDD